MNRRDFLFGSASVAALAAVPAMAVSTLERFWLRDGTIWGRTNHLRRVRWLTNNDPATFTTVEQQIFDARYLANQPATAAQMAMYDRFIPNAKTVNVA